MASTYEVGDTRVGSQRGLEGAQNVSRTFLVTLDNVNDDPIKILQVDVPLGSKYPNATDGKSQFAVIASDYVLGPRPADSKTNWIVVVLYRPLVNAATLLWKISIEVGLETEHINYTVPYPGRPSKGIGPPEYRTPNAASDGPPPIPAETPTHQAGITSSGMPRLLVRTNERKIVGYDATRATGTMTLYRTQPNFNLLNTGAIMSYVSTVNKGIFRVDEQDITSERDRGVLKFIGFKADPTAGEFPGQPQLVPGQVWDVRLAFVFNAYRHTPIKMVHTWENDKNYQVEINVIGGPTVVEYFDVLPESEFSGLLGLFN